MRAVLLRKDYADNQFGASEHLPMCLNEAEELKSEGGLCH